MIDDDSSSIKAVPDTGALSVGNFAGRATQKVQLDIDDALFLDTEEEKLPAEKEKAPVVEAPPPPPLKFWQRKPVQISAGVLLLLVLGVVAYFYFMATPAAPPPAAVNEPTVIVVPSPESITGEPEFLIKFAPFMVEQRDNGTVHFLQANFTAVTRSKEAASEAQNKVLVLRDAIFYYLRNKTHQFLIEPTSAAVIKQDLLDVVNGYLAKGKVDNFLFENYLLK